MNKFNCIVCLRVLPKIYSLLFWYITHSILIKINQSKYKAQNLYILQILLCCRRLCKIFIFNCKNIAVQIGLQKHQTPELNCRKNDFAYKYKILYNPEVSFRNEFFERVNINIFWKIRGIFRDQRALIKQVDIFFLLLSDLQFQMQNTGKKKKGFCEIDLQKRTFEKYLYWYFFNGRRRLKGKLK